MATQNMMEEIGATSDDRSMDIDPLTENDAWAQSRLKTAEAVSRGVPPPCTPCEPQSQQGPEPAPQQQAPSAQPQPQGPASEPHHPQVDKAPERRFGRHASDCSNSSQRGAGREASRSRHRAQKAEKRRREGRSAEPGTPQRHRARTSGIAWA